MKHKPLVLLCDCGGDTIQFDLWVEPDDDFEGYISFSTNYYDDKLRAKFKAIWAILRGKRNWFNEVILDEEDAKRVSDYLIQHTALVNDGECCKVRI